jgi:type IV pilus assembly protein PilC
MTLSYTGFDKDGTERRGVIEAVDIADANVKLKNQGIVATKVSRSLLQSLYESQLFSFGKISDQKLAFWARDLSIFLRSGITIANAIRLTSMQYAENKNMTAFLASVENSISEGKPFYQALEDQKTFTLPVFFKQSIKVAESRGALSEVLTKLAQFIGEKDKLRKQISSALAYPLFIVGASMLLLIAMFTIAVPKMISIFESLNQELPAVTKGVISVSNFMSAYGLVMLIIVIACIATFATMRQRSEDFRVSTDKLWLRLPLFGKISQTAELSRLLSISSMLISSGLPFIQAIKHAIEVGSNAYLKEIFTTASYKVVEGQRLSVALAKEEILDKVFVQSLYVAEETGEVESIFENLSLLYAEENKTKLAMLTSLIEPILILLVGGCIGTVVVAMLLPIFSISIQ